MVNVDKQAVLDFFRTIPGQWVLLCLIVIVVFLLVRWITKYFIFFKNKPYKLGREKLPFQKWVDRFAFWKNILPEKFRDFLSKYDGTLPESVYNEYEKKNKKEMEVYPRQMLVIYILIDLVGILVLLRLVFGYDHHMFGSSDNPTYVMVEHIDVAGLINGALATILAIIIARIVESENETKKEELDKNILNIKQATAKIDETNTTIQASTENLKVEVEKILASYTALERKDSFEERLEANRNILEMAKRNPDNCLYFMGFSADFGFLRSQNVNVLMEEIKDNATRADNLRKVYNTFNTTTHELDLMLKNLCWDRPDSVFLAFLDISENNRERASKYQKYLERVLGNDTAEVIPWQKQNESFEKLEKRLEEYCRNAREEDTAFYIDFSYEGTDENLNKQLQEELVRKNNDNIKELKTTRAQITLLDRMAFQFILTMPGKEGGVRNRTNQCCVIIFSNIDAIGDNAGVYAFQSTDKDTIDNLKKIYETYRKQQEGRDKRSKKQLAEWQSFTEFFGIKSGYKSYNSLKFKALDEDIKEFLYGVAMADIKAAVSIQQLFRQVGETVPEIIYPMQKSPSGEEQLSDYSDAFFDREGTYFAIGLFGENEFARNAGRVHNQPLFR